MTIGQLQELNAGKFREALYASRSVRFERASRSQRLWHWALCRYGLHDPTITHIRIADNQVGFMADMSTGCGWCQRALGVEYAWGDWPKRGG